MATKNEFRVSVRDLVAATQGQTDLGHGFSSRRRAMDGIREHTRLQDLRPDGWAREVPVSLKIQKETYTLEVFGRMDGLLVTETGVTVEEIKTCLNDPSILSRQPKPGHLAQVKCYGYMVAREQGLSAITLVLTYARTSDGETAAWEETCTAESLELFFEKRVSTYLDLLGSKTAWEGIRNQSIHNLGFPYTEFRKGQRDFAEAVYKIIKHKKLLFGRAPTGTGKTMATLFPAIKAMGMGQTDKLFYLTAKSPGRTVAVKALDDLAGAGARIKRVVITAKQKTCFTPEIPCDMETCIYARAYYTKLARAMDKIKAHDRFDQELIEKTAKECELCPFEFSLDLSLISDVIICDLNYAFDPRVYLKRFFDRDQGKLTFLVDEAHNLPDRLRSMYSADLEKKKVLAAQDILRDAAPKLALGLVAVHKEMVRLQTAHLDKKCFHSLTDLPEALMESLDEFASRAETWLDTHQNNPVREPVLEIFFMINGFLNLARHFGSHYRLFVQSHEDTGLCLRLFCLDPAPIFARLIKRCQSAVLFSATFFPFSYYEQVLFGTMQSVNTEGRPEKEKNNSPEVIPYCISLPSPFPRENFNLVIHMGIKTTFRQRNRFYPNVAELITHTVNKRPGNHLVFFSSYAYMEAVIDLIDRDQIPEPVRIQIQDRGMDEEDRQAFLDGFTQDSQTLGFAVMGGIFGEGIDLEGDRLTTVMIVGVGLPQVNPEQEEIRAYYDTLLTAGRTDPSIGLDGFFIAYQMPGFSRVLQAVGRLIRSDSDKGLALLMDERFVRPDYLALFPQEWKGFNTISTTQDLDQCLGSIPMNIIKN